MEGGGGVPMLSLQGLFLEGQEGGSEKLLLSPRLWPLPGSMSLPSPSICREAQQGATSDGCVWTQAPASNQSRSVICVQGQHTCRVDRPKLETFKSWLPLQHMELPQCTRAAHVALDG